MSPFWQLSDERFRLTVATPFLVQRLMKYARCVKGCYATLSAKRARGRYDFCWPRCGVPRRRFTAAVGKVAEVTGTSQNRRDTAAARPVRNGSTRIDWDR